MDKRRRRQAEEKMIPNYKIYGVKALKTYAERRQNHPAEIIQFLSQTMDANLIMIYGFLEDIMNNVNSLETALNKSTSMDDIKQAKIELERILKDRGKPTQEQIKQFRELTKRAKNVYR
jgi:hypothetical protein